MQTEIKVDVRKLCRKIAKQTNENDHTGAVITLAAALMGAEKIEAELVAMREKQIEVGHITHELYEQRQVLSKKLDRMAAAQFSADDFTRIQRSF